MKYCLLFLTFFGLSISACSDESDSLQPDQELTIRTVGRSYDEMACIVDNKAGIRCFESIGKTCKKEKSCTPLETLNATQFFSQAEISNWYNPNLNKPDFKMHMYEIGWFVHPSEE